MPCAPVISPSCWPSSLALALSASAQAFDPAVESSNFNKGNERQAIYNTPEYRALLAQVSAQNQAAALAIQAADPEREFDSHLCGSGMDGCAGDARLYDWEQKGYGIKAPVLWTARNGATISGHVWATKAGPAKRPGIVITNGSVQAAEQLYWFVAQTLAKAGYVVLTWDPQGQGQSDTRGETPDENEGTPAQSDGRPFFDGTVDALDFFFSNPAHPLRAAQELRVGHEPRGQAGPAREGRARTRPTTRTGRCWTPAASASPGTPTAPRASATSGSPTRG